MYLRRVGVASRTTVEHTPPVSLPANATAGRGGAAATAGPDVAGDLSAILTTMSNEEPVSDAAPDTTSDLPEELTPAEPRVPVAAPRWTPPAPPERRSNLVPKWLPVAAASLVVVLLATVGLLAWRSASGLVRVPNVAGLEPEIARQRLAALDMELVEGDKRFSADVPDGYIVDQEPKAGAEVRPGTEVLVAISAGSERLAMPDVIGKRLDTARSLLSEHGLNIVVEPVPSQEPSGTVLLTYPSPGVTIATGQTVRLSVASTESSGGLLLPTDLTGKSFVIDPSPMPSANPASDPPAEVARRLRALLEASGATVSLTREAGDAAGVSVDQRVARASATTQTAIIGLEVSGSGPAGLSVRSAPDAPQTRSHYVASTRLAQAARQALQGAFPTVGTQVGKDDVILILGGSPAMRVMLGSASVPADSRQWSDPQWADNVARAIYRSLARTYGPE